ncbi:MAG: dihydroxyacetone kinase subunit DhaL [Methyloglobulus sp.]|nr:dihydroxyacetone kinase subunit L [Methyloglobulus sp.]
MDNSTALLPGLIQIIAKTIETNAVELTALDQAIGDGDHVTNLQRGIQALSVQSGELATLEWQPALQKMGMTIMSSIGGASGSLYGTLFVALSKNLQAQVPTLAIFADAFAKAVDAVKQRGKADKGEKTMLDVLIPVAEHLHQKATASTSLPEIAADMKQIAMTGAESTRDMVATKGRASFLGERSKGHIDAGAKSSQLMICALVDALSKP